MKSLAWILGILSLSGSLLVGWKWWQVRQVEAEPELSSEIILPSTVPSTSPTAEPTAEPSVQPSSSPVEKISPLPSVRLIREERESEEDDD